jgi:dTDP-4-dehydrorhamnose 3,5-epimerase
MKIISTDLEGALIIEPDVFGDHRGFFMETYHLERYRQNGIHSAFVQDNLSYSNKGTLRGLHYQIKHPQAKLVQVLWGEVFDVAVDIRPKSFTFGKWIGVTLSHENHRQFFIPKGFAHGFCVLSENALFSYKCSDFYSPHEEGGLLWSDPDLNISWPVKNPIVSEKDACYPRLCHISPQHLPATGNA